MASQKRRDDKATTKKAKENRDPITGEPGAHPIGTGVGAATGGAAAGAAAGAAVGTVAGPVGTAIGAAVGVVAGAVGGGLAGKAVAENINPTLEHEYWRGKYAKRPYVQAGEDYEEYGPAYQAAGSRIRSIATGRSTRSMPISSANGISGAGSQSSTGNGRARRRGTRGTVHVSGLPRVTRRTNDASTASSPDAPFEVATPVFQGRRGFFMRASTAGVCPPSDFH